METTTTSGWNRSSRGAAKAPAKKPSAMRGILAGISVVVIALVGLWLVTGPSEKDAGEKVNVRPEKARDQKNYRKVDEISHVKPRKQYETKSKSVEEALQRVEEAQEPLRIEPLPKPEGNGSSHPPKRTFHTCTEQLLSWLCHVELGEPPIPPPPLPDGELANLASILISKNEVSDDDSPSVANAKRMVDAAKKEMMKFIKEGGNPDEFMQYVFREQCKAFETRNLAIEMYEEMSEDDPAMAKDFAKKVNERLTEQGIVPIHLHKEHADIQDGEEQNNQQE